MLDAKTQGKVRLLVSVRDAHEAAIAAAAGVDIIDVKEPTRGPLGRADAEVVTQIVTAVAGRAPVTMAMGELTEWLAVGGEMQIPAGVSLVKMGLAHAPKNWRKRLFSPANSSCGVVAVAYADAARVGAPSISDVLMWAVEKKAAGLLIDTAVKDGRGLFDWTDAMTLAATMVIARNSWMFVALAGSLSGESLSTAAALKPDIVAVRGAACAGRDRQSTVDADAIAACFQRVGRSM